MSTPLLALTWGFWRRHQWGLAVVAVVVLGFALAGLVRPFAVQTAMLNSMVFIMGLSYVIGVFAYGFDGRLEGAESGFPARHFLLPVRTWLLVGWPMVQGMVVAVGLWVAWDRCLLRPSGIETPLWWTPMLAAVVASSQAIVWLPFGLPWARILVATVVLVIEIRLGAILSSFIEPLADPGMQDRVLSVLSSGIIGLAYLVARAGVSRARRGDAVDWLAVLHPARRAGMVVKKAQPFHSAMQSQVWFEWRLRGRAYVIIVLSFVTFLIGCAWLVEESRDRLPGYAATILLIPILVACMGGLLMGYLGDTFKPGPLTAFLATRPLSNVVFVIAKVRTAGWAAVVCWVLVLLITLGWLVLTGGWRDLPPAWEQLAGRFGPAQAGGLVAVLALGPVLMIWRIFVVNFWAALTGRSWIGVAQAIVTGILFLQFGYEWVQWNSDPERRERILGLLPWVAVAAIGFKLALAAVVIRALHRRGDLSSAVVVRLLAVWCVAVIGLFAVLAAVCPADRVPLYALALGAVLFVPLARPALAPLALAWNRHR